MIEDIKIQRDHFIYSLKIALGIVVFCIIVHLIFIIIPTPKYYWSIYPRDLGQWYGIFTGHYIHASWGHLASNLPPLIAFVFFSGIFRRNIKSVVLMVIMVIMYSGYTAGFIPTDEKVSWESHLFGAIAGLWTAFIFRNYREKDEVIKKPDWYNDHTNKEEELNSGFTTHSIW